MLRTILVMLYIMIQTLTHIDAALVMKPLVCYCLVTLPLNITGMI